MNDEDSPIISEYFVYIGNRLFLTESLMIPVKSGCVRITSDFMIVIHNTSLVNWTMKLYAARIGRYLGIISS